MLLVPWKIGTFNHAAYQCNPAVRVAPTLGEAFGEGVVRRGGVAAFEARDPRGATMSSPCISIGCVYS